MNQGAAIIAGLLEAIDMLDFIDKFLGYKSKV
jgi:hypothetical protein